MGDGAWAKPATNFHRRPLPPTFVFYGRKPRTPNEAQALLDHIRTVAFVLDAAGALLGISPPVDAGIDPLLAIIAPLLGDAFSFFIGCYIILMSLFFGITLTVAMRMGANLALDACTGLIPFIGPILDIAFKANVANVALLENHLRSSPKWAILSMSPPRSWNPFSRKGQSGATTFKGF